jgi:hypothetical protein
MDFNSEWAIRTESYRTVDSPLDSVRFANARYGSVRLEDVRPGCHTEWVIRTIPYIPPSIRFGSRSKIPSREVIRLANARYGSVRLEDVWYGEPSLL